MDEEYDMEEGGQKISIDDFNKLDLRVGVIRAAERIQGADRLLKLSIDLGEPELRQILAGVLPFIADPTALAGKTCVCVANMSPRTMRGLVSNGMLLAASTEDGAFSLLTTDSAIVPGARVK